MSSVSTASFDRDFQSWPGFLLPGAHGVTLFTPITPHFGPFCRTLSNVNAPTTLGRSMAAVYQSLRSSLAEAGGGSSGIRRL